MPQTSHADPTPIVGALAGDGPHIRRSIPNLARRQVTDHDINGATTDGAYTSTLKDEFGATLASVTFTASSNTAAQIAAGLAAAILADYTYRGYVESATVVSTDHVRITFRLRSRSLTVEHSGVSATPQITAVTAVGYASIPVGVILQSDTTGGFTETYSDAALALGVVYRGADFRLPADPTSGTVAYEGPAELPLLAQGEIYVAIATGVTVYRGDKVYFNPTTDRWSNASSGSHVLVEGAQWQTSQAGGVGIVYVNLPSES